MNKPRIKTIVVAVTIAVAGVFAAISADRMELPAIPSDFESSIGKDIRKKLSKKEYEALKLMMTSLIISAYNSGVELEKKQAELQEYQIQLLDANTEIKRLEKELAACKESKGK